MQSRSWNRRSSFDRAILVEAHAYAADRKGREVGWHLGLGTWGSVVWDPRRALPIYAKSFIEKLTEHARRSFPGKEFEKVTPPVPSPKIR